VSRTRCSVLHAVPQSRDRNERRPLYGPGSAAHHKSAALRPGHVRPDFLPARALSAPPSSPRTPPDQRAQERPSWCLERRQSGRSHRTRNAAWVQAYRRLESLPLRHKVLILY
jgi:hypothetical protein